MARRTSSVHTEPASPYSVSLAFAIASSSSRKRIAATTGPKISSRTAGESRVDVGEDRRLDEVAAELRVRAAAARPPWRPRASAASRMPVTLANCASLASGPISVAALERVAEHDLARALGDPLDQLVVDVLVDDEPRAGHAGLPGGREHAGDDAVGGGLEVGVGEHDLGRLAAELERDAREVARRALGDVDAGLRRAGEGDLVDARVAHERAPDRRARCR